MKNFGKMTPAEVARAYSEAIGESCIAIKIGGSWYITSRSLLAQSGPSTVAKMPIGAAVDELYEFAAG